MGERPRLPYYETNTTKWRRLRVISRRTTMETGNVSRCHIHFDWKLINNIFWTLKETWDWNLPTQLVVNCTKQHTFQYDSARHSCRLTEHGHVLWSTEDYRNPINYRMCQICSAVGAALTIRQKYPLQNEVTLMWPLRKKSIGLRSGNLGGQATGPPRPVQRSL